MLPSGLPCAFTADPDSGPSSTNVLSCWLILFAFALKNFVTISVLYSPQSVVVSALQFELWSGGQPEVAAALGTINMLFSIVLVLAYTLLMKRATAR